MAAAVFECPECGSHDVTAHQTGARLRLSCDDCSYWWLDDEAPRKVGECPRCGSGETTYLAENGTPTTSLRCRSCGYREPDEHE